jgi:hypothetical protein
MRLPLPIFSGGNVYTDVEIKKPKTGLLTKVNKELKEQMLYSALHTFISGSIESVSGPECETISDLDKIKNLCWDLPYGSAIFLSVKIVVLMNRGDDAVEGVYVCDKCNHKNKSVYNFRDEIDTRDHIDDLTVNYLPREEAVPDSNKIEHEFQEPIEIKTTEGEPVLDILSMSFRFPTLKDCNRAYQRYPSNDDKTQFAIYLEALETVNGDDYKQIENGKFKTRYGISVFHEADMDDTADISEKMHQYGMDSGLVKTCMNCKEDFVATINTANFFASALLKKRRF